jgi:hypothetical protein
MNWEETDILIERHFYGVIRSKNKFFGEWIIVEFLQCNDYYWVIEISAACVCCCSQNAHRFGEKQIPTLRNSILVSCNNCERPLFRLSGFFTCEWKMEVPTV